MDSQDIENLRIEIWRLKDAVERLTLEIHKLANPPIIVTQKDVENMEKLVPGDVIYSEPVSDLFLTKVPYPDIPWIVTATVNFGSIIGEGKVDVGDS